MLVSFHDAAEQLLGNSLGQRGTARVHHVPSDATIAPHEGGPAWVRSEVAVRVDPDIAPPPHKIESGLERAAPRANSDHASPIQLRGSS
jgi:hypothetical protein